MKSNKPNVSVKNLRSILGQTQAQFADFIGVSLDLIKSIECGRKPLSPAVAQRIQFSTGARTPGLLAGNGEILDRAHKPYTRDSYDSWTKILVGESSEEVARGQFDQVKGWIELLFLASARHHKNRLPAVWMSLVEWLDHAREDFGLGPEITALLKKRSPSKDSWLDWCPSGNVACPPEAIPPSPQAAVQKQSSPPAASYVRRPSGRKPSR